MPQRRFLLASSLARLIRKQHGTASRIVEGYFPGRFDRTHFVSLETDRCLLVLGPPREGAGRQESTEVPRAQAEALMAVCAGKVGFECTGLRLQGGEQAVLRRFVGPGALDLLSVEFAEGEDPNGFRPPSWFGPEVTQNAAYDRGSLARAGLPEAQEILLSNSSVEECLDALEEGIIAAQLGRMPVQPVPASSEVERRPVPVIESTRRDSPLPALPTKDAEPSNADRAPSAARTHGRPLGERVTFGLPGRKLR